MRIEKKAVLVMVIMGMICLFTACGNGSKAKKTEEGKDNKAKAVSAEAATGVSVEVNELYQSQGLMLEMLVNESCNIEDDGETVTVSTKDGLAYVSVSFIPGIQNLGQTASLIPTLLEQNYGAVPETVEDGTLFGARAKNCEYMVAGEEGKGIQGLFAASVINQSLYLMDVAFSEECTEDDVKLIVNVFTSMNVLRPATVDSEKKTATYESKYPEASVSKASEKTYKPVTEWVYLPYYYYGWDSDYDYTSYDESYYEPDWDYYSEDDWWSWSWDEEEDWDFYDDYADWYEEDYYDSYEDYYDDYDPYSDPGDYYDDYELYSDPGDSYDDYDPYSDPGDSYDDYETYSDPGDSYDDYDPYSDPGDSYDDYDPYSDPGDSYDDY